jgi:hypothetical protein
MRSSTPDVDTYRWLLYGLDRPETTALRDDRNDKLSEACTGQGHGPNSGTMASGNEDTGAVLGSAGSGAGGAGELGSIPGSPRSTRISSPREGGSTDPGGQPG